MHSIDDLRQRARARLPRVIFDFIDGGAGNEAALRRNEEAFQSLRLVPRAFVSHGKRELGTVLFGQRHALPFGVTPMGLCNLAWPGTDQALAAAAAASGFPYVLSTMASTSIEDIAAVAPDHTWFQIYLGGDAAVADALLDRAQAAGIKTLMLTVDANFPARRLRDRRNGFSLPLRPSLRLLGDLALHPVWSLATFSAGAHRFANFQPAAGDSQAVTISAMLASLAMAQIDWSALERLRERWRHRLIVKGVLHPQDARRIAAMGADGVMVSNHGGRQLASAPSSIEVLPAIRQAVGPDFALLLDSGVRSGEDIAKALAGGADFVLLGRAFLYGVAALGPRDGAAAVADILRGELETAMAQLGCAKVSDLKSDLFYRALPNAAP